MTDLSDERVKELLELNHDTALANVQAFIDEHFHNQTGRRVVTQIPAKLTDTDIALCDYLRTVSEALPLALEEVVRLRKERDEARTLRDEHFAEIQRAQRIIDVLTPTWHAATMLLSPETCPNKDNVPIAIAALKSRAESAEAELKALREQQQLPVLESGQRVHVEHPRFHGDGEVVYDTAQHKRYVGVLLENGNIWDYERETVTALPAPEKSAPPEEKE